MVMRSGDREGKTTSLLELVRRLNTLDNDLIIYAEANPEWSGDSAATVGPSDVNDSQLAEFQGMPEFLDVPLAKEIIDVWQRWRDDKIPTEEEILAALIYYATNDAYMPE